MEFKIENFEGPLDLLLKMIEKQEMDITKVSLAKIADQYVEYIKSSRDLINPEEIGDFLVLAARLLYLKSKVLLPYLAWDDEEEDDELEQQLKIYKEFLEASQKIDSLARKKKFLYFPQVNKLNSRVFQGEENVFSPPKKLKKAELAKTFREILQELKKSEFLEEKLEEDKIDYQINIEDKINSIRKLISRKVKFNFHNILENSNSKTEVIVSFLAILELSKQKFLVIAQEDLFAPIIVNSNQQEKYE